MNPLTVFPRHPSAPETYYINGAWAPAAITAVNKRFTDAELAAEYWAAAVDAQLMAPPELVAITATFRRFCTQPAHDDGPA